MIDTSVLVAGVAGFKAWRVVQNPSASFLRDWIEAGTFTWLVTEEILAEYKGVLNRLGVRRNLVGEIINLLREEAELVTIRSEGDFSPDPDDNAFCACAEQGRASFIVTLNTKHFPPKEPDCQGDFAWGPDPHDPRPLIPRPVTGRRVRFGRVRVVYECGFFWPNLAF